MPDTKQRAKRTAGAEPTRERLLTLAENLFAEKGFAGTSVRELGAALGVANATILYHFRSKRKLYAAVLERIASSVSGVTTGLDEQPGDGVAQIKLLVERFMVWARDNPNHLRVIMRELMENPARIGEIRHWYLADWVKSTRAPLERLKGSKKLGDVDPTMFVLHLIGAVSYFYLALPTIAGITGRKNQKALETQFKQTILQALSSCLAGGQPARR